MIRAQDQSSIQQVGLSRAPTLGQSRGQRFLPTLWREAVEERAQDPGSGAPNSLRSQIEGAGILLSAPGQKKTEPVDRFKLLERGHQSGRKLRRVGGGVAFPKQFDHILETASLGKLGDGSPPIVDLTIVDQGKMRVADRFSPTERFG